MVRITINHRLYMYGHFLKILKFWIFYIVFKNIFEYFKMWPSKTWTFYFSKIEVDTLAVNQQKIGDGFFL